MVGFTKSDCASRLSSPFFAFMERAKALYTSVSTGAKTGLRRLSAFLGAYGGQFLSSVETTIVIIAFLYAVDYFTANSSINVSVPHFPEARYDVSRVSSFYAINNIDLPDTSLHSLLRPMFRGDHNRPDGYINVWSGSTEQEILQALKKGQSEDDFLSVWRIKELEQRLRETTYKRQLFGWDGEGYDQATVEEILATVKEGLSVKEYYELVVALMSSRVFDNMIYITNSGETNLTDVTVTIPAPVSRISGDRSNTILGCALITQVLTDHEVLKGKTLVHAEALEPGQWVNARISTTEFALDTTEFSATYTSSRVFHKQMLWVWFSIVWIVVLFIKLQVHRLVQIPRKSLPRRFLNSVVRMHRRKPTGNRCV
jgi:hypothetical protein